MAPRRSLVWLVALVVVASVAATAHGLYAVAVTSGVPWPVAVVYPLITDGLALVAYAATKQLRSAKYAWLVIVVAAGLSGLAQAVNLAGLGSSPTWLRFGVGYWPAVAVLFAAHLLWLVGRPRAESKEETDGTVQQRPEEGRSGQGAQGGQGGLGEARQAAARGVEGEGRQGRGAGEPGVLEGERPGDRRGEGRPLVPQVDPLPPAVSANGNGNGETKTARAIEAIYVYEAEHGRRPSRDRLADLAGCSDGTARIALSRTRPRTPA